RRARGSDLLQFLHELDHRLCSHRGLYPGRCDERTCQPTHLECTTRSVGVPLVLAKIQVDPARELPSQNRVEDEEREVVFMCSLDADVADSDLRLCRPR